MNKEEFIDNFSIDLTKSTVAERKKYAEKIFDIIDDLQQQVFNKTLEFEGIEKVLKAKEQENEELYKEKMKLIETNLEQKSKIQKLVYENATKEVTYKINGKCAKTVANKVKEISAIVEGKDCKYNRYKQALDEIEELNKQMLQTKIPFCTINERIQNIISEAKEQ